MGLLLPFNYKEIELVRCQISFCQTFSEAIWMQVLLSSSAPQTASHSVLRFFMRCKNVWDSNQEIRNGYINTFIYTINIPSYHSACLFDSSQMFLFCVYLEKFGGCWHVCVLKLSALGASWLWLETEIWRLNSVCCKIWLNYRFHFDTCRHPYSFL